MLGLYWTDIRDLYTKSRILVSENGSVLKSV